MDNLTDAHWFPLTSQGNIYSMTKLCSAIGSDKILVASLKRKIYSCEYNRTPKYRHLRPLVKELLFTYIPNGAEIISIDAYNKSEKGDEFVIGITIMKTSNDATVERYLNIYTEGEGDGECDENSTIETVAQNCLMVELSYTPYHLYHTTMPSGRHSVREVVWLLSGSDYNIHMIREDEGSHDYAESSLEKHFPELENLEAIATWIDIYYYNNQTRRVTAVGCECGLVKVSLVDVENINIIKNWTLRYDKPVSSVRIFCNENVVPKPKFLGGDETDTDERHEEPALNILVVNTVHASVVFMDILYNDMEKDVKLAGSDSSDCVLCSCIADINMDGKNEILLGTYNQEILVYTLVDDAWEFKERRLFDAPVHSMAYLDLTGDGMKELAVLTQRGVHVLQHDPGEVEKTVMQRFRKYLALRSLT
ncbi:KICSTOR complex protein kaptin isoform X1 [Neodiprion pinetum]|uniref:KICSTOR complex protein kaptin isoform X1 n=1 Tax=Neodiprion pinetum TaxID=441929 RepID=UPI001EDFD625|nr:KICSTOR complex protein kaptin-like isoform X1 [Neodiprion pinetum]